jgi:hypothetical protein
MEKYSNDISKAVPAFETIRCKCGHINLKTSNFCGDCGRKLVEVCNCWVKKKPYNCGFEKCPGRDLGIMEKRRSKS